MKLALSMGSILALLVLACTASAEQPPLATIDIRQAIADLETAVKQSEAQSLPMDHMDNVKKWDNLLLLSANIKVAVDSAIRNSDAAVAVLKTKSEKYNADPAKAEAFTKRIETLQTQSEAFVQLGRRLEKAIAALKARVEAIKADPDVKQAMEVEDAMKKVDAAVQRSSEVVPAFMQ